MRTHLILLLALGGGVAVPDAGANGGPSAARREARAVHSPVVGSPGGTKARHALAAGIVGSVLLGSGGWTWSAYNRMVTERETVAAHFSSIDIEVQRRADLIPNLLASASGYAKHERATLESIANARTGYLTASGLPARVIAAEGLFTSLQPLEALGERYPDLKASRPYQTLMDQLGRTENRIAEERLRYDEAARAYNTGIQTFPRSFLAAKLGFRAMPYFGGDGGLNAATAGRKR